MIFWFLRYTLSELYFAMALADISYFFNTAKSSALIILLQFELADCSDCTHSTSCFI